MVLYKPKVSYTICHHEQNVGRLAALSEKSEAGRHQFLNTVLALPGLESNQSRILFPLVAQSKILTTLCAHKKDDSFMDMSSVCFLTMLCL